jgi:hypothetical protein
MTVYCPFIHDSLPRLPELLSSGPFKSAEFVCAEEFDVRLLHSEFPRFPEISRA